MITDIYRIKTRNSIYEIQVSDRGVSRCRKSDGTGMKEWRTVKSPSTAYLDKLCIGPGFDVPGVVDTSNVEDYHHFVLSSEPKRKAKPRGEAAGIQEFFGGLTDHVVRQARGQAVRICSCGRPYAECAADPCADAQVFLRERR